MMTPPSTAVKIAFVLVTGMVAGAAPRAAEGLGDPAALLARYCHECHGPTDPEAGVDLTALATAADWQAAHERLEDSLWLLDEGEMPPRRAERHPDPLEREQMVAWLRQLSAELTQAQADDPGIVVAPRLTPAEYEAVILDLTGMAIAASRILPAEGGAGEGFTNVGAAHGMGEIQVEKFLAAADFTLQHARFDPVAGATWHPHPMPAVPTAHERRNELVAAWTSAFFEEEDRLGWRHHQAVRESTGMLHGAYLEAAWRYRHRDRLGLATADLATIARAAEPTLSPAILANWWALLHQDHDQDERFLLRQLVARWQALPGPDAAEATTIRQACRELDEDLERWSARGGLTKGRTALEPRHPRPDRDRARLQLTLDFARSREPVERLYLVATTALDGDDDDVVTWSNGRFTGAERPWSNATLHQESGPAITWGTTVDGRAVPADGVAVQAPSVLTIAVPSGSTGFSVEATVDAASAASVQVAVLHVPPSASQRIFFPQRCVLGGERAQRVARACLFLGCQFIFPFHQSRGLLRSTGKEPWYLPAVAVVDPSYLDAATFFDERYVGLPVPFERDPLWPYHFTTEDLLAEGSDAFRAEVATLRATIARAAQVPHQDLRALLASHGHEAAEGVVPATDPSATWPADDQQRYRELVVAVAAAEAHNETAARDQILSLTRRAWRRQVTDAEIATLLGHYREQRSAGLSYDAAVKQALRVVLMSPHFLYRLAEAPTGPDLEPLGGRALADRLAFFLWSSIPDAELLERAERGALADPAALKAEVARMLADPRAARLASRFAAEAYRFGEFELVAAPDAERFPGFTPELRTAMRAEVDTFFSHLFRDDRPITDCIEGDYSFINQALATHYGIRGIEGDHLREVRFEDGRRGGLLGMGAILTMTSHPSRTSPVLRGNWILTHVLGLDLPDPPPDVPRLSDGDTDEQGRTIPEQLAAHRADPACASCHQRLDPPGLALEGFDPVGRWRETYDNGDAITARDTVDPAIDGIDGLRRSLEDQRDRFVEHFCRQLLGFALGRALGPGDKPLIERMTEALAAAGYRPRVAIELIVTSQQFTHRRTDATTDSATGSQP